MKTAFCLALHVVLIKISAERAHWLRDGFVLCILLYARRRLSPKIPLGGVDIARALLIFPLSRSAATHFANLSIFFSHCVRIVDGDCSLSCLYAQVEFWLLETMHWLCRALQRARCAILSLIRIYLGGTARWLREHPCSEHLFGVRQCTVYMQLVALMEYHKKCKKQKNELEIIILWREINKRKSIIMRPEIIQLAVQMLSNSFNIKLLRL
jgi:hypothetical protein